MNTRFVTSVLALSLGVSMAMAAEGVRYNIIEDSMLKERAKGERAVSVVEKKYNDMMANDINKIGFVLSDPHERINDAYASKYGGTSLDNLGFMSVTADEALRPLLLSHPELGGFSPFNLYIWKMTGSDTTTVGHITPTTMLDIVGVKDPTTRKAFEATFVPLDQLVDNKLGGKISMVEYDTLTAQPMMNFEITFNRPDDLNEFIDEFQERLEAAFEERAYIIAGYKNFRESYDDLGQDFSKYDAYFVYSLCHFKFSNAIFNNKNSRPDAGAFAPCSMYFYIAQGSNKMVIGMPKLENWISVMGIKDGKKIALIHELDKEVIAIIERLGGKQK